MFEEVVTLGADAESGGHCGRVESWSKMGVSFKSSDFKETHLAVKMSGPVPSMAVA